MTCKYLTYQEVRRLGLVFLNVVWFFAATDAAHGQGLTPLENVADAVADFLTGGFARSLAIIAVVGVGMLFFTGNMRLAPAAAIILGIALVFGAASIVDSLVTAVT